MDLVLRVGGGLGTVRFDAFLDIGRDTLSLLTAMHQVPTEEKPTWVIAKVTTRGGLTMRLAARTRHGPGYSPAPFELVGGVTKLERLAAIPPAFTEETLERVERLGRRPGRGGITYVELAAANGTQAAKARVTPTVVANAEQARHTVDEAFSSVEGVLDVVNARNSTKPWVSLFDPRTRRAVRCDLAPSMGQNALDLFGTRVRMYGMLQRNGQGQGVRLRAEGIETVPDLTVFPRVRFEDLAGAAPDWTGGVSAVEWVRVQRAAGD